MDDMTELPKRPKTAPPLVKDDTVNQYDDDEKSTTSHPDHDHDQIQTGSSLERISLEPYYGNTLPRVDISENPMRDGGKNERGPMMGYPPRQFAATPDSERSPMLVVVDEMSKEVTAREKAERNDDAGVSEVVVESMSTTSDESRKEERDEGEYQEEADDEGEMEDDDPKRKPFETVGKPVERVASPMKPRPSSPIPGAGRRPQIPFMAFVVGAAVEKKKLDDELGPDQSIYEQSTTKYSSLLTPHEKHANKMSLVAEIMQTDSYGSKLQRTPSATGRYQPIGTRANDASLLRPCEMNLHAESRGRLDMQQSAPELEKDDDVQVRKEKDGPEKITASKLLGKLLGKAGSKSEPATTEERKPGTTRDADSNQQGLASTAGVLTSVIRWKTKKMATGTRDSREKYPGYLDLFNRLSHELNTSVPFPILLQTRREALPIIQSIAKAYKSTLGPHHQMTQEACAKVDKLRSELQDRDVFV